MKTHYHRYLEMSILLLILYSIVIHVVEIEFADDEQNEGFFHWSERVVAVLFTIEYIARWVASRSIFYPFRIMAIVDLLATLPFYFGFMVDLRSLRVIRAFRILRLLKLARHTTAMQGIANAFYRIRYEFSIIGFAVIVLGLLSSTAIYELEHTAQPEAFAKLSDAAWFVLATITTVGYGDKVPVTPGGRLATALVMIAGLGLFGTFVSLIGSAFLDELRRSTNSEPPQAKEPTTTPLLLLTGMTSDRFDPNAVLKAINHGSENGGVGIAHDDAIRLLTAACQRLLIEKKSSPQSQS